MELQPLGVQVLHVAPAAISSNIAKTGFSLLTIPENSLWKEYAPDMIRRINASQGENSMNANVFAKEVVKRSLKKSRPFYGYLAIGGGIRMLKLLTWFPKTWVLRLLWKKFSTKV